MSTTVPKVAAVANTPITKPLLAWADPLFLFRPVLLGPVWTIYLAGFVLAGGVTPGFGLFAFSLLVGGIYIHNQIEDIDGDRINRKLFLLPLGIVSVRSAWLWMGLAWVVAGVWASMDTQRIVVYGMGMCLGVLYNHKRWSWKDRPYVGLLANIVGHGSLTFVAGWMAAGGGSLAGAWASVPYGLAVGCTFILTTVVDHEGDRASGKNTLAVASGIRSAKRWASGCCSCAAIGGAVLGDVWMALAACVTLALMGWDVYYTKVGAGAIAKVSVGVLALTVALRWPPLLVMAGVTFVAARVYYSRRFQKRYPVLLDAGQKA